MLVSCAIIFLSVSYCDIDNIGYPTALRPTYNSRSSNLGCANDRSSRAQGEVSHAFKESTDSFKPCHQLQGLSVACPLGCYAENIKRSSSFSAPVDILF